MAKQQRPGFLHFGGKACATYSCSACWDSRAHAKSGAGPGCLPAVWGGTDDACKQPRGGMLSPFFAAPAAMLRQPRLASLPRLSSPPPPCHWATRCAAVTTPCCAVLSCAALSKQESVPAGSSSLVNEAEAAVVLGVYRELLHRHPHLRTTPAVGVISPYKAQVCGGVVCVCRDYPR